MGLRARYIRRSPPCSTVAAAVVVVRLNFACFSRPQSLGPMVGAIPGGMFSPYFNYAQMYDRLIKTSGFVEAANSAESYFGSAPFQLRCTVGPSAK